MRFLSLIFAMLLISSMGFGSPGTITQQNQDIFVKSYKAYWNLLLEKTSNTNYRLTSFDGTPLTSSNFGFVEVGGTVYRDSKDVNLTQGACNTLWGSSSNKTVYLYTGRDSTKATSVSDTSPSTDISGGSDTTFKISVDQNPVVSVVLSLAGNNTGSKIATEMQADINAALIAAGQRSSVTVTYASSLYNIQSNLSGVRSSVIVTAGASNDISDDLKIGVTNSGVETAGIIGIGLCASDTAGATTVGSTAIGNTGYMSCSVAFPSTTKVRQIGSNSLNCTGPVIGTIVAQSTVTPGTIANGDISSSAAIDYSKLATLTSGNILVGSAGNVATSVTLSGDATVIASGAMTLAPKVYVDVTGSLTQAQIIALHATPIDIISAPGSGKAIAVDEIELFHSYSTTQYANGSDFGIQYKTSATVIALHDKGLLTANASKTVLAVPTIYSLDNSTGTSEGFNWGAEANHAIQIAASGTEFDTGAVGNVLKYRVRYHVITLQN